jgi:hypothetical protein
MSDRRQKNQLWRLAESPGLHIVLPNAYFASLGIPSLFRLQ